MSASSSPIRLQSPEEIATQAGARAVPLRLPDAGLFAERALRLRAQAPGHAMRDYLLFAAELVQRQHERLQQPRPLPLPDDGHLATAAAAGEPPLAATRWPRHPAWRDELRELLAGLLKAPIPALARDLARQLQHASDAHLEQQAQALLAGGGVQLDAGSAPFIGAALQLHWTRLVQQVQDRHQQQDATHRAQSLAPFGLIDDPTACPCCGSRPVAAITRLSSEGNGQRYLACHLCGTQWHYVRIKCSHCQGTKGISYRGLQRQGAVGAGEGADEDTDGARSPFLADTIQAEVCEPCGHYLKVVHMEKDLQAEPLADDLASLTLDLLVSELGLVRHGFNPLLVFGEAEPAPVPAPPAAAHPSGHAPEHSPGHPPPDPGGH